MFLRACAAERQAAASLHRPGNPAWRDRSRPGARRSTTRYTGPDELHGIRNGKPLRQPQSIQPLAGHVRAGSGRARHRAGHQMAGGTDLQPRDPPPPMAAFSPRWSTPLATTRSRSRPATPCPPWTCTSTTTAWPRPATCAPKARSSTSASVLPPRMPGAGHGRQPRRQRTRAHLIRAPSRAPPKKRRDGSAARNQDHGTGIGPCPMAAMLQSRPRRDGTAHRPSEPPRSASSGRSDSTCCCAAIRTVALDLKQPAARAIRPAPGRGLTPCSKLSAGRDRVDWGWVRRTATTQSAPACAAA